MLALRELSRQDIPVINTWRNNKEVIDLLGAAFRFIDKEVDDAWYDAYLNSRGSQVRLTILSDDKPIGLVSLTGIDTVNRSGEFHIMIGDTASQNKGAGTFALNGMLRHAFENLNLHRVSLSVLSYNERAIHLYEKAGFVTEGVKRQAVYKNGAYADLLLYGILKDEYQG